MLPQGTRASGLPLQGFPAAHTLAPTWTGAAGEVFLHRPQLLPLLQLEDQLKSGNRTPCSWRKEKDTRISLKTKKSPRSSVGLQDVDKTSE